VGPFRLGSDIDLTLSGADLDSRTLAQPDAALDDLLLSWRFDVSLRSFLESPALIEHIARVCASFGQRHQAVDR
jgi:hypothetical protein